MKKQAPPIELCRYAKEQQQNNTHQVETVLTFLDTLFRCCSDATTKSDEWLCIIYEWLVHLKVSLNLNEIIKIVFLVKSYQTEFVFYYEKKKICVPKKKPKMCVRDSLSMGSPY